VVKRRELSGTEEPFRMVHHRTTLPWAAGGSQPPPTTTPTPPPPPPTLCIPRIIVRSATTGLEVTNVIITNASREMGTFYFEPAFGVRNVTCTGNLQSRMLLCIPTHSVAITEGLARGSGGDHALP
jgi:hypothetical protein